MNNIEFDYDHLAKSIVINSLDDSRKNELKNIISSLRVSNAKLEIEFLKNLNVDDVIESKSLFSKHFKKSKMIFNEFPVESNIVFKDQQSLLSAETGKDFLYVKFIA